MAIERGHPKCIIGSRSSAHTSIHIASINKMKPKRDSNPRVKFDDTEFAWVNLMLMPMLPALMLLQSWMDYMTTGKLR